MSENGQPSRDTGVAARKNKPRRQGIFWALTVPDSLGIKFTKLPPGVVWIRGQQERGESGYLHQQVICALESKQSLPGISRMFPGCHAELTRSGWADKYVWKSASAIADTQFEFGAKPILRSSKTDWEAVWTAAQIGDLLKIPANIRVVSYRTIRAIGADFARPIAIGRTTIVYWGRTGSGKSHRAWEQAGVDAYPKDPRTKFWTGYQGQQNVVIDEFRGGIDISHLLRWLDRYPVHLETKGSSTPSLVQKYWITSNLEPVAWYPELDSSSFDALARRMQVIEMNDPYEL